MGWIIWITYGVIGGFGMGMTYSIPMPKHGIKQRDFTPLEALKTPQFYAITFTLMLA